MLSVLNYIEPHGLNWTTEWTLCGESSITLLTGKMEKIVKVVADSLNYLGSKEFVVVPSIPLAVKTTAWLLDGYHMVF